MKKLIIVLAVGLAATDAVAQTTPKATPQEEVKFTSPKIVKNNSDKNVTIEKYNNGVNSKGYKITVITSGEEPIIVLQKKGSPTHSIRMSMWNAKPSYFENKYGHLPPPPPPPAPPPAPPAPSKAHVTTKASTNVPKAPRPPMPPAPPVPPSPPTPPKAPVPPMPPMPPAPPTPEIQNEMEF